MSFENIALFAFTLVKHDDKNIHTCEIDVQVNFFKKVRNNTFILWSHILNFYL